MNKVFSMARSKFSIVLYIFMLSIVLQASSCDTGLPGWGDPDTPDNGGSYESVNLRIHARAENVSVDVCVDEISYNFTDLSGSASFSFEQEYAVTAAGRVCIMETFAQVKPGAWQIDVQGNGWSSSCQVTIPNHDPSQTIGVFPGQAGCSHVFS